MHVSIVGCRWWDGFLNKYNRRRRGKGVRNEELSNGDEHDYVQNKRRPSTDVERTIATDPTERCF